MAKSVTSRVINRARERGVTIYTRTQWGSIMLPVYQWRRRYRKHLQIPKKPTDTVWQHITVTYDTGRTRSSFKKDMRTLERIGSDRFGTGVSYNWCIDAVTGEVGLGQSLDAAGAHTLNDKRISGYSYNQNYVSIAISVIGMPGVKLSARAGAALVNLLKAHQDEGVITETFDYNPHSLVAFKSCPTPNIQNVMGDIRNAVAREEESHERLSFWTGTFNLGPKGLSIAKEKQDLEKIVALNLDFFGLQEVGEEVRESVENDSYKFANNIGVNTSKWQILNYGKERLSDRTFVGKLPKRKSIMPPKDMFWAKLKDRKTKEIVWVANVHLVASRSRSLKRRVLHSLQMRGVAKWMEEHKNDSAVVLGDWNLDHINWNKRAIFARFRNLGFTPNWKLGFVSPTFGKGRYIDAGWSNMNAKKHLVHNLNSDHNGLTIKYAKRI